MNQLSLFGDESRRDPGGPSPDLLVRTHEDAAAIAARLPDTVRFGTSSWSFPGWAGLVYQHSAAPPLLAREGLREYARHPLLRTVGVDRSFYAPVPVEDLHRYAAQLPSGFPCCFKAPASVASEVLPGAPRDSGAPNPDYLSAERFSADLLEPVSLAFRRHAGPFVIECSPPPRGRRQDPQAFTERLDQMLEALPREFLYAVELRDRRLMTPAYVRVLRRHRVAHVYNYWSAMPMPVAQAVVIPPEDGPFLLVRLLLRPGTWYEDQRERYRPFDKIVEADQQMRDDVVELVGRAVRATQPAYVLVNNKAEGSAPLTIRELALRVASRLADD